ncbi:MAG: pro-sigmaK processing inhibitor BofA family protein [Acetanaerobacterium sp.]
MTAAKITWVVLHILLGIIVLVGCKKSKTRLRSFLLCSVLGFAGLMAVSFTAGYTGITISLSPYTTATSLILGLPGVILMLVLNLIIA